MSDLDQTLSLIRRFLVDFRDLHPDGKIVMRFRFAATDRGSQSVRRPRPARSAASRASGSGSTTRRKPSASRARSRS